MRTETEIREKYDEMLKHLELFMDKVRVYYDMIIGQGCEE